jgi:hypothetical protein
MHARYLNCLIQQVTEAATSQHEKGGTQQSVLSKYHMDMRILTVSVNRAITLCDYAEGVKLPEHVFQRPSIQECM